MTEDELDTINHQLINILFRLGKVAKDNKDVLPIVAEIDALVKRAGGAADRGGGGGDGWRWRRARCFPAASEWAG